MLPYLPEIDEIYFSKTKEYFEEVIIDNEDCFEF